MHGAAVERSPSRPPRFRGSPWRRMERRKLHAQRWAIDRVFIRIALALASKRAIHGDRASAASRERRARPPETPRSLPDEPLGVRLFCLPPGPHGDRNAGVPVAATMSARISPPEASKAACAWSILH